MKILSASTVRNEGPYLLEWIAWHQVLGVTDFLVYSNDCDDGSDLLLNRLAEHGANVVVSSRKADACEAAVKEINAAVEGGEEA